MKPSRNKGTKHFVFAKSNVNICMDKTKSTVVQSTKNSLHAQQQETKITHFSGKKQCILSLNLGIGNFQFWCTYNHPWKKE